MMHQFEDGHGGEVTAEVSWPSLPAGISAALELSCHRCGYKLRLQAKQQPQDFDAVVEDFLKNHTVRGCHSSPRP